MNILFIGDIVGQPGRQAVISLLPELTKTLSLDAVFANGENLSRGLGMTINSYQDMIDAGITYFTSGNHIFDRREFTAQLDDENIKVLRPLNYPPDAPGRGFTKIRIGTKNILLVNLIGRAFFYEHFDDPYRAIDKLLNDEKADIIIVDNHAEATSEKMLMGHYLDGRVQAVIGTHTHVPTADAMILPKGTAYITDVGMVGPLYSSLGGDINTFLEASKTQLPFHYKIAEGDVVFSAVHLNFNNKDEVKEISLIRKIIKK